jgi:prevent-host-death family protein
MEIYTTSEARTKLYKIVDQVSEAHQPVYIKGRRNKAVILSEEDFNNMQETLYLLAIPGMHEAIKKGIDEPIESCSDNLDW